MGKGGLKIKPKSKLGNRKKIKKDQQLQDLKTKNSNFKRHNIQYAPTTAPKQSVALKELHEELSYPEIVRCSDKALKSLLLAEGVLRTKAQRPVIMCWSCSSRVESADSRSSSLRCSGGRACPTRARLSNVDDAFTPFGPTAASGCDKDLAAFVRTAWCYGMKAGNKREGTLSKATMCCAIHVKRTCVYEYCVVLQTLCRLSTKLNISDHAAFATAATHEQYIEALVFAFLSAVRKNQEFNIRLKATQCSTRAGELCEVTTLRFHSFTPALGI